MSLRPELSRVLQELDAAAAGREIHAFAKAAYPIPRSLTGDGVRRTLELLRGLVAPAELDLHEVPSGTQVLDWTVPPEWNVRDAYVALHGERVIDWRRHNLHLVGYSVPVDRTVAYEELLEHLHSLPAKPDVIPYRTSYYKETWGFCVAHRQLQALPPGDYHVRIDATLAPGNLTWGEVVVPGESDETVLVSTHVCHPSLANDNLSGLGVVAALARRLAGLPLRYTYRFLFVPGTVGAIAWLATRDADVRRVRHGLVAANLGDAGPFHYKRCRRGDAVIDRAVARVLADSGEDHRVEGFVPFGYDERQYCSPGYDLPVGSLTRTPWGRYPEYHTSADDLSLIAPEHLGLSLRRYLEVVHVLEHDLALRGTQPYGEPQLGRRGLYRQTGGGTEGRQRELALLWVLNLADGDHTLLAIAERSQLPFQDLLDATRRLLDAGLVEVVG